MAQRVGLLVAPGADALLDASFTATVVAERVILVVDAATMAVVGANENALKTFGKSLSGLSGMPLTDLCLDRELPATVSAEIAGGEPARHTFDVVGMDGSTRTISATWSAIGGVAGSPERLLVAGFDVTDEQARTAYLDSTLAAIDRSQAVIEFDLNGSVVAANDNFLTLLGYQRDEVIGRHHRLFVDPAYAESGEYRAFWKKLSNGEFDGGEYRRIAKDGTVRWIQATYNPVLDRAGGR